VLRILLLSTVAVTCLISTLSSAFKPTSSWAVVPRGGDSAFTGACDDVKNSIIDKANKQIEEMRRTIIDESTLFPSFGQTADTICNSALEEFALSAPTVPAESPGAATTYDKKLEELEATLDAPLHVLYLKQLALIRESALQGYRAASKVVETSDYDAMLQADAMFTREAGEMTREGSDWSYAGERSHLQAIMNDVATTKKKLVDVQMKNSEKQSTAMAFLQQQQQMIQQLQQQLYGQSSPWNVGMAYRIPDTNFNLQGSYQSGRTNLQLSCVPDEYAPMLGANGFTSGVGPGNLGLSLNLSL